MSEYRPLSTSIAPCCSGSLFFSPCLYVFPYVWFTFYLAFLHSARVPNLHLIHFFTPFPSLSLYISRTSSNCPLLYFFSTAQSQTFICLAVEVSVSFCLPFCFSLSSTLSFSLALSSVVRPPPPTHTNPLPLASWCMFMYMKASCSLAPNLCPPLADDLDNCFHL